MTPRAPVIYLCLVPLAACLLPLPAAALSPAEIQARARQIGAEWTQARGDASAEQALIGRLGPLALAFVEQCEQAARAGSERRDVLRPPFEAVYDPLNGIYAARSGYLERQARAVMDADGDLEALEETPEWRTAQVVAVQALYYLNWLNFYGARLHDGARRKELLEAAERGFSEFTTGERKDLAIESLLGRGLCHLELGKYEFAVHDFRTVLEEPTLSPERRGKARLALLDAYSRGGQNADALRYSQQLLGGGGLDAGDATLVRFVRLQVLFDVMKGGGPAADGYRREASSLMEQLRRAGGSWPERVDALMVARVDDPAAWVGKVNTPAAKWELANLLLQKNDEANALPLLTELAGSADPAAADFRAHASYLLGVARFKAGDHAAALAALDAALAGAKPDFAADAAYMRFKTLEALMAKGAGADVSARYVEAMQTFLAAHPDHASAYEARYRLGEYLQAQNECAPAIDAYAEVRGHAGFELRAQFGTVQCRFELLQSAGPGERAAALAQAGADLARFTELADAFAKVKDRGDVPLEEFQAKGTILQAVYASLQPTDGAAQMAALLAGFEQRYPNQRDLFPQVVRLRLGVMQQLGQFAEAEREVAQQAAVLGADARTEAVEKLAGGFARAGARRKADGDAAGAKAAEQVALRLYETLAGDGASGDKQKLTLARLYQSTGDPPRATALYQEVLQSTPGSLPALRGLAQLAEEQRNLDGALTHWRRYIEATRPGDPPWYDGRYQQARLLLAKGDKAGSCGQLKELKPAMPGLSDADLRRQLNELYAKACG